MPDPSYELFLNPDGTLHQTLVEKLLSACVKAKGKSKDEHQRHFFEDLVRALEELLRHRALKKEAEGKTTG